MPEILSTVEYRDIPGFPGYRVGSDGSVWSCRKKNRYSPGLTTKWHPLKMEMTPREKYRRVKLARGRKGCYCHRAVHQLVLEAFIGPRPAGMSACHKNDDKADNRLQNLRWDTPQANGADAKRNGRYDSLRGSRHYRAKLTEEKVREIRRRREAGEACRDLAREFGVSNVLVSLIARRKIWSWLS